MDKIDNVKQELDRCLQSAGTNVGSMFGDDLFAVFRQRGWLTLETFGMLGTSLFATQVPAYERTHFAFVSWGLGPFDFKVGQSGK